MIKRLTIKAEHHAQKVDDGVAERPRLSMAWYLDPITGKPVARWVREALEVSIAEEWATAA